MTLSIDHEILSSSEEADRRILEELGHLTVVSPVELATVDDRELPSIAGADLVESIDQIGRVDKVDIAPLTAERKRRLKKIQRTLENTPFASY